MRGRRCWGTVTVAAGATIENVPFFTIGETVPTTVTITATYSGVVKTATLTVNPAAAALLGVSVNPTAVTGNAGSTGTVTLTSAAPAGGAVVTLRSSNTNAATVLGHGHRGCRGDNENVPGHHHWGGRSRRP